MKMLAILALIIVVMVTDCMTNASTNSLSDLIAAMQNTSLFVSDSRQGRQMVQRFGSRVSLNQLTRAALGPVYPQPSTPGLPRGPPVNVQVNQRVTQHDSAKDSQQITGGPFLTPPVPLGGNFDLSLNARPPSPPPPTVSPPAPPPPSTLPPPISVSTPSTRRPSPSPQPGQSGVLASDIRCMRSTSREQLRATITSSRPLVAPPVLVLRPEVNPLTSSVCSVLAESEQQLSLTVSNLDACGVETCRQPNGENWLCLTVRFPVIAGIQLPEDDVIQIQCRPQDRSHTVDKQLNVAATGRKYHSPISRAFHQSDFESYDQLTASAFIGDVQQFQCEVALFRRTPGSDLFSTLVKADDVITLGEEIHLRSIVRAGDGWEYSKLTDVLVQKLSQDGETQTTTSIPLLFNDGCRNQVYQLLAPQQPARHQKTQLITNFPFRVFAFQGMTSGDRLQVTARVTGCIEAIDCAPTACSDGGRGFGRRRRDVDSGRHQRHRNNVTNWNRDMAFSVVLPDFTNLPREASPTMSGSMSGCPAYLLGSLLSALVFCMLLLGFAVYAFNVRRGHQLRKLAAAGDFTQLAPHCGGHTDYESQRPPLDVAVIGTDRAGRFCTVRQAKRRGLRMRRSFSTGNLSSQCTCRGAAGAPDSHVSVVQIPAEENIYCELATRCDVQPTMV